MKYCLIALLFLIDWTGGAAAVDRFAALEKMIIPENVSLGMSPEDFTASRPAALEGPTPLGGVEGALSFTEILNQGSSTQVAYWYFFYEGKLGGVLKTQVAGLIGAEQSQVQARETYVHLVNLLGEPRSEPVLRNGESGLVTVQAETWRDDAVGCTACFIATTQEITTALVVPSHFPLNRIFLSPDPERFATEMEPENDQSVNILNYHLTAAETGAVPNDQKSTPSLSALDPLPTVVSRPVAPTQHQLIARASGSIGWTLLGGLLALVLCAVWRSRRSSH